MNDAVNSAHEINRLHAEAVQRSADSRASLHAALQAAWRAGRLLIEEKKKVHRAMGHGAWQLWLKRNFSGTSRTAQYYMKLAGSEADPSALKEMSLRQTYLRLGIATEPKSHANRAPLQKLPDHVRFAHKLVVALKPTRLRRVTPDQCATYRQDLRQLYDLLRPLFEPTSGSLAFPRDAAKRSP